MRFIQGRGERERERKGDAIQVNIFLIKELDAELAYKFFISEPFWDPFCIQTFKHCAVKSRKN